MLGRGLESLIPPNGQKPENGDGNIIMPQEKTALSPVNVELEAKINEQSNEQTEKKQAPILKEQPATESSLTANGEIKELKGEKIKEPNERQYGQGRKYGEGEAIFQIEVDKIRPNPHQPRRNFAEESLRELAVSIREFGVIQPLIVTKKEKDGESGTSVEYELIAGERRLLAAKLAGLRTVPVIVRRSSEDREKLELAIIENIQRADLNPIESARAFAKLQDEFRLTQREIAARLGKSREAIANSVRLLNLPSEIQDAVSLGRINESQARMLLSIVDIPTQKKFFQDILRDNLSVREIRSRVKKINSPGSEESPLGQTESRIDPEIFALKDQLEEFFGTKIDLKKEGEKGAITINFYSSEELNNILGKILKQTGNQS